MTLRENAECLTRKVTMSYVENVQTCVPAPRAHVAEWVFGRTPRASSDLALVLGSVARRVERRTRSQTPKTPSFVPIKEKVEID